MKTSELMIGDWVKFPIGIEKIIDLPYIAGRGICASFAASATLFPVEVDKLEPILLTEEILVKNFGVVERSSDGYKLVINRELILAFHSEENLDFWIAQPRDVPHLTYSLPLPKYVHEFQHALRLCDIEIEIKL